MIDLLIIYIMSIITFALFGWDKHCSIYNKSRIPEAVLFMTTALCGAFGALCAMIFFNHKTKHTAFVVAVPVLLFLQLAFDIVFRVFLW